MVPTASNSISAASRQNMQNRATPSVQVSPGILIAGLGIMVVLVISLSLYLGPWTVGKQWAAMSATANNQVTDVVQFAIQAYESQNGMYDASISHHVPETEGEATFVPPMMAFSMPRHIIFSGKTNQGNYIGTYGPTDGEVTADIQIGGYSVGGLVDVAKATGNIHITGREKDGKVAAEINGTPLQIVVRPVSVN